MLCFPLSISIGKCRYKASVIKIKIYICVMSNEQQEHEKERVSFVIRFLLCTPTGDINIMICELFYMYTVIEDHCMWSYVLSVFPLSDKLSMSVLSMWVLKRSPETSRI